MTRGGGDEDIEGAPKIFTHAKGVSLKKLGEGLRKFVYFKTNRNRVRT